MIYCMKPERFSKYEKKLIQSSLNSQNSPSHLLETGQVPLGLAQLLHQALPMQKEPGDMTLMSFRKRERKAETLTYNEWIEHRRQTTIDRQWLLVSVNA